MDIKAFREIATLHETRFPELGYARMDARQWRFVDISDAGAVTCVGPFYSSRAELLGDLPRYAAEFGCQGAGEAVSGGAIEIRKTIRTCSDCRHLGHSGQFTPGGARPVCDHPWATDLMSPPGIPRPRPTDRGPLGPDNNAFHWRHREVGRDSVPPASCPLRHGQDY